MTMTTSTGVFIKAAVVTPFCSLNNSNNYKYALLYSIAQSVSNAGYCDRCYHAWSVRLSVCLSHLRRSPLKPLDPAQHEMPFGADTLVAQVTLH